MSSPLSAQKTEGIYFFHSTFKKVVALLNHKARLVLVCSSGSQPRGRAYIRGRQGLLVRKKIQLNKLNSKNLNSTHGYKENYRYRNTFFLILKQKLIVNYLSVSMHLWF